MTFRNRLYRGLPFAKNVRGTKTISRSQTGTVNHGQPPAPPDHTAREPPSTHHISWKIGSSAPFHKEAMNVHSPYWQRLERWKDVGELQFLDFGWQNRNTIVRHGALMQFLEEVLPSEIPASMKNSSWNSIKTRDDFVKDVSDGIRTASMATRITPHILSVIDWDNPLDDPVRRQFLPMLSQRQADHWALKFDSLGEKDDSPVPGLVHRYHSKVLFLATTVCPVYCRFCTRSYAVGTNTESVSKDTLRPTTKRLEVMFEYIRQHSEIEDVVVSGGDSYLLAPERLRYIGETLLAIPHIRRFRFATKGLAVSPGRIIESNDAADNWTNTFIDLSNQGRELGKEVAMHTHFNHPHEITWITEKAARRLFNEGVTVRNQSVLLKGVNDDADTMSQLITSLANINIKPYYVYQSDMVAGTEDLRTPLSTILSLEKELQGTIGGHMLPKFIVDLPGGGGKRNAHSYESYDPETGVSKWTSPAVDPGRIFTYHDPAEMEVEIGDGDVD